MYSSQTRTFRKDQLHETTPFKDALPRICTATNNMSDASCTNMWNQLPVVAMVTEGKKIAFYRDSAIFAGRPSLRFTGKRIFWGRCWWFPRNFDFQEEKSCMKIIVDQEYPWWEVVYVSLSSRLFSLARNMRFGTFEKVLKVLPFLPARIGHHSRQWHMLVGQTQWKVAERLWQ